MHQFASGATNLVKASSASCNTGIIALGVSVSTLIQHSGIRLVLYHHLDHTPHAITNSKTMRLSEFI